MALTTIITERLELVPITEDLSMAELSSLDLLREKLHATIPEEWPPDLVTSETIHEFIELLNASGGSRLLAYYWIRTGPGTNERILIGSGGSILKDDGIYEIGYSVLEPFQRMGYATEAISAITTRIKDDLSPVFIRACTFPSLAGSIRVLEKNDFVLHGSNEDEGTIEYRLYC
jgi:RimJ/RimL family protein N-acetyltransferase